ncbi:hypothetical protein BGZ88_005373, partial [Linnemannia elongata]
SQLPNATPGTDTRPILPQTSRFATAPTQLSKNAKDPCPERSGERSQELRSALRILDQTIV